MKTKKKFSDVFSKYKTYDDSLGRGSIDEWRDLFNKRYSAQEAKNIIKEIDPYTIMDLSPDSSLEELRSRYRILVMQNHPDKGGDPVKCKQIIAAYSILEKILR